MIEKPECEPNAFVPPEKLVHSKIKNCSALRKYQFTSAMVRRGEIT